MFQQQQKISGAENDEYELYINKDAGLMLSHQRPIAQLDFSAHWGSRLSMPDVLQALVCDHLDLSDLRNL